VRAENGRKGFVRSVSEHFDAIVLDRLLPELDGLGLLTALRAAGVQTPVLILSALSDIDERVRGVRAEGDDYLSKPFEGRELTHRLDALLRRRAGEGGAKPALQVGDLVIDLLKRTVRRGQRSIELATREYDLLAYLMRHAGQIVTREMLFEEVWRYRHDERSNVIDVHIGRLRRKVDARDDRPMIFTVRGAGNILKAPA
jgi:DNA-binding response OmpR family regulator